MTSLPTTATLTDLQGPLTYWGPAVPQHTPGTTRPRPVAHGLTPLEVAARTRLGEPAPGRSWTSRMTHLDAPRATRQLLAA